MIFYINLFLTIFLTTFLTTFLGIYYLYDSELYIPIINYLINTKIYVSNFINNLMYGHIDNKFKLFKCDLYTDLTTKYDVTQVFLYNIVDKIDKQLIEKIYSDNNLILSNNEHIRLKITFSYNNEKYILYYPYIINKNLRKILSTNYDNYYYIPYPPYNETIIENYRKNIVVPTYLDLSKKIGLYNLFGIETKNIEDVMINNISNKKLYDYMQMTRTPFNDFGILYDTPIKLSWILVENNIDIISFNNFYLKYLLPVLDEDKMELVEHSIKLENINDIIISKRMKDILKIN
jgi:hypothetical protein